MQIGIIKIVFIIFFLLEIALASDTILAFTSKCNKENAVDSWGCYSWLNGNNAYDIIQTGTFYEYLEKEECCLPLIIVRYGAIFSSNSFAIEPSTKIDSLFYAIALEIAKLPNLEEIERTKSKLIRQIDTTIIYINSHWLNSDRRDCRIITISKSLFALLNKTEQDSLYSMIARNRTLSVTDSLFSVYLWKYRHDGFPPIDILACSIQAKIKQEINSEYTLTLNNTSYKMAKLSDNHYVVRFEKENAEKNIGNRK